MPRFRRLAPCLLFLVAGQAHAELWQGAQTPARGEMVLGGYAQVYDQNYVVPTAFMGFIQFAYGQSDSLQIETRLGFGMVNVYVGFFGKYRFWHDEHFALAAVAGLHFQTGLLVDADFVASFSVGILEVYLSPAFNVTIVPPAPVGLGLIPGLDVAISKHFRIYAEADVNLTGYYNAGGGGLRYFF